MLYEIDHLSNMKRAERSNEGLLVYYFYTVRRLREKLAIIMSCQLSFLVTDNLGGDDGTRLPSHCAFLLFVFLLLISSQAPYSVIKHHLVGICYFFAIGINR